MKKAFPIPVRVKYSCAECPAYCCSYPEIEVTPRDIQRLARHFGLGTQQAEERFTKRGEAEKVRLLRHRKDRISIRCASCSTGDAPLHGIRVASRGLPRVSRQRALRLLRFLKFERAHQDDPGSSP